MTAYIIQTFTEWTKPRGYGDPIFYESRQIALKDFADHKITTDHFTALMSVDSVPGELEHLTTEVMGQVTDWFVDQMALPTAVADKDACWIIVDERGETLIFNSTVEAGRYSRTVMGFTSTGRKVELMGVI